jgi:hypothetical protein
MNHYKIKAAVLPLQLKVISFFPKGKIRSILLKKVRIEEVLSSILLSHASEYLIDYLQSRYVCPIRSDAFFSPYETNQDVLIKVLVSALQTPGLVCEFSVGVLQNNHRLVREMVHCCSRQSLIIAKNRHVPGSGRSFVSFVSKGPKVGVILKKISLPRFSFKREAA